MDYQVSAKQPPETTSGFMGQKGKQPQTKAEAAQQFEEVLVRQLVQTLTDDLFSSKASGPLSGSTRNQARMQSDALTDVLTQELTQKDTFGISKLLLKKWQGQASAPNASSSTEDL